LITKIKQDWFNSVQNALILPRKMVRYQFTTCLLVSYAYTVLFTSPEFLGLVEANKPPLALVHAGLFQQHPDNGKCIIGVDAVCPVGSFCDQESNLCKCKNGFLPGSSASTDPMLSTIMPSCLPGFNASCADNLQCHPQADLLCSEDTKLCICPLRETHFSEFQMKCVVIRGSSCSEYLDCTDNAVCSYGYEWICKCLEGFSHTRDGRCRSTFGSSCHRDDSMSRLSCNADEFLECVDEKCGCESERIWDAEQNRCLSLVGGECHLKVTTDMFRVSRCLPPASCSPKPAGDDKDSFDTTYPGNMRTGICQCLGDTALTDANTCGTTSRGCLHQHGVLGLLLCLEVLIYFPFNVNFINII
jgi:hypothetical protein